MAADIGERVVQMHTGGSKGLLDVQNLENCLLHRWDFWIGKEWEGKAVNNKHAHTSRVSLALALQSYFSSILLAILCWLRVISFNMDNRANVPIACRLFRLFSVLLLFALFCVPRQVHPPSYPTLRPSAMASSKPFIFGAGGTDTLIRMDETPGSVVTGDRSIRISDDGAHQMERLHNITHKKRRVRLLPEGLDDSLAEWIPVPESGCRITKAMDAVSGSSADTAGTAKRKSYASSVRYPLLILFIATIFIWKQDVPMSEFPEVQQLYLDETMFMNGLGYSTTVQQCGLCEQVVGAKAPAGSGRRRFFRCQDCGIFLQCVECCLKRHALAPLHFLEVWHSIANAASLINAFGRNGRGSFGRTRRSSRSAWCISWVTEGCRAGFPRR